MTWFSIHSFLKGRCLHSRVYLFQVLISQGVAIVTYLEISELLENLLLGQLLQLQERVFLWVLEFIPDYLELSLLLWTHPQLNLLSQRL